MWFIKKVHWIWNMLYLVVIADENDIKKKHLLQWNEEHYVTGANSLYHVKYHKKKATGNIPPLISKSKNIYYKYILVICDQMTWKTHKMKANVSDLVKFVICTLVSRVHMMFYILTKGYTVFGNQGTHDKLNQIHDVILGFRSTNTK